VSTLPAPVVTPLVGGYHSFQGAWDPVVGASSYQVEWDGVVSTVAGHATTWFLNRFFITDLAPESVHTFRARSVSSVDGPGPWSPLLTVVMDPMTDAFARKVYATWVDRPLGESPPAGYTRIWNAGAWTVGDAGGGTRQITYLSQATGRSVLRHNILSALPKAEVEDVEVAARLRVRAPLVAGATFYGGVGMAMSDSSEWGLLCQVATDASNVRRIEALTYNFGGEHGNSVRFNQEGGVALHLWPWPTDEWFWVRLRFTSGWVRLRAWVDGAAEPTEWALAARTRHYTPGTNIGLVGADNPNIDFGALGIATGGETAPTAAPAPVPAEAYLLRLGGEFVCSDEPAHRFARVDAVWVPLNGAPTLAGGVWDEGTWDDGVWSD
jgi:hypothetical protein